jgi:hypothetical protein
MAKISLAGFRNPATRPRYIIWTLVGVVGFVAVMGIALGVTSTRWFCSEGCHKVQDDTIVANEHSSHSEIACMACHMPAGASPVTFMLHKVEALGELYLTVTDQFELPLNPESEYALTMPTTQCTQCHNLETRVPVTPSLGIVMQHEPHDEMGVACPICHNRTAHVEDFDLVGVDPQSGEPSYKHVDFMTMTACFRCHSLESDAVAPGGCEKCHTPDFDLKPPSHDEASFDASGHAEQAKEAFKESATAKAEAAAEGKSREDVSKTLAERRSQGTTGQSEAGHGEDGESLGEQLPPVDSIFVCSTCHTEQYCAGCHGMEMPHPEQFLKPIKQGHPDGHPAKAKVAPEKCAQCHGENEDTHFCDDCHHGEELGYPYDSTKSWEQEHPKAVEASGTAACTDNCHSPDFCADCHIGNRVVPRSHKQKNWTNASKPTVTVYPDTPAEPSAKHALDALKSAESCEICHGSGGANAKYCKSCHKAEMPHDDVFKKQHISGQRKQDTCRNCHDWRELCSNCHHADASLTRPWMSIHGKSVNKNGSAGCVEKCHKKTDCANCHQKNKVTPTSHRSRKFVRDYSDKDAKHVELYNKDAENCALCHRGELPNAKFCKSCHKVVVPHSDTYGLKDSSKPPAKGNGGDHAELLQKAKTQLPATCANCHKQSYCDSCHHVGSNPKRSWKSQHHTFVKKNGAKGCFGEGGCHEETFCAYCHVRTATKK